MRPFNQRATALLFCVALHAVGHAQDDLDALFGEDSTATDAGESEPSDDAESAQEGDRQGKDTDGNAESERAQTITLAEQDPPAVAAPSAPNRRTIEEIVVTAQKTEQSLQDVPISVSAIGGEFVKDAGITDVQDMVQFTPNVKFSQALSAQSSLTIRGFGTPPLSRSAEPSVGLVIDDIFYGRTTFTNDGAFDLERLEVLRGPQGTLFGKNTVAGVLNFTTVEPSFEQTGYALLSGGTLDAYRAEGGFGFPLLNDVLAARISFRARRQETGQINTAQMNERELARDVSGRLRLSWLISDSMALDLLAFSTRQYAEGIGFQYQVVEDATLDVFHEFDPEAEGDVYDGHLSSDGPTFFARNSNSLGAKLVKRFDTLGPFDGLDLNLILNQAEVESPFELDNDHSPIPWNRLRTFGPELFRQRSLEFRLTGGTGGLFGWGETMDWIAGIYYFANEFAATQHALLNVRYIDDWARAGALTGQPAPTAGDPCILLPADLQASCEAADQGDQVEQVVNIIDSEGQALALFAQTTWYLSDRWSTVIGLRVGREEKSAFQSSQSTNNAVSGLAGQQDFEQTGKREESEFSPKLAVSYEWSDAITLFGNAAKGFKSGGFSGPIVAPSNTEFEAETAFSLEAGIKSRLLDETLSLNLTAFMLQFDDLQLALFDGVNISTVNAAAAEAVGLEMDFQWLPPLQFLTLRGSAGFTLANYKDFPCGPAKISDSNQDNPPECPQPQNPRSPAFQDLSGETLPFAPRVSASISPSVKLPLWPAHGIGMLAGIDVLYQGEHYLDADLDPHTYQPATTKINARLGIAPQNGPWKLIFNAKNLTGEQERLLMLDTPQLPNSFVAIPKYDEPVYTLDLRYELSG